MTILAVIIALSLLILVHEAGHFLAAKWLGMRVDEFGFGFPPKLFSKKWGETEYSFNALPFGGFVKIYGEDHSELEGLEEGDPQGRSFVAQPAWKKSVVVLAGVLMNVLLAWLFLSIVFVSGVPQHLAISGVMEGSPAEEAGLQTGDILMRASADGTVLEDPIKAEAFVNFSEEHQGEEITLTLRRTGEMLEKTLVGRVNPTEGQGSLGIALADMGVEKHGLLEGLWASLSATLQMLWTITLAFGGLIVNIFRNPEVAESLTGPVGIFVVAREAGNLGFVYLLQLTAIISVNLAILNLIPFPALDGGRWIMIMIEKIKGSPIPDKVTRGANALGFALLILLMVWVTVQDIGRFF